MAPRDGHRRPLARWGGAALATMLAAASLAACSGGGTSEAGGDLGGDQVRGVDGDTVTLGAITVESGPMAAAGRATTAGNRAYFAALNDAGGLAGRYEVEVEVVDGADDAESVLRGYDETRPDVAMYVQMLGFRAAGAALESLSSDDVLAGAVALDVPWPRHQNLLALGTPVTVGVHNALDWYVHRPGARSSVCALADEGDYGAMLADGVTASASLLYLDKAPVLTLTAGDGGEVPTPAVAAAVDQLAAARCDVVVAATLPGATTAALARAAATGFAPVWFVPTPGRPDLDDAAVAAYAASNVWLVGDDTWSGPGPEPSPATDDMEAARAAHAPDIADDDPWFRLGYLQAMATHQVLERAVELDDLTPAGILLAANYSEQLEFDGLTDDYPFAAPEYREPPRTTVLTRPGTGRGAAGDDDVVTVGDDLPRNGQTDFEAELQALRIP